MIEIEIGTTSRVHAAADQSVKQIKAQASSAESAIAAWGGSVRVPHLGGRVGCVHDNASTSSSRRGDRGHRSGGPAREGGLVRLSKGACQDLDQWSEPRFVSLSWKRITLHKVSCTGIRCFQRSVADCRLLYTHTRSAEYVATAAAQERAAAAAR